MDGLSLRGDTIRHRERVFTTHSNDNRFNVYPSRALRDERWKYIRNLHPEFLERDRSPVAAHGLRFDMEDPDVRPVAKALRTGTVRAPFRLRLCRAGFIRGWKTPGVFHHSL